MRTILLFIAAILIAFITSCNDATAPNAHFDSELEIANKAVHESNKQSNSRNFRAHLNVAQEIPEPDVDRNPQGQSIFKLSRDGTELSFKLIVANIENVTAAHIHLAQAGQTGGVVVWLYPIDGPPGQLIEDRFNGVLSEGIITGENLTGELEGEELSALIDEIRAGNAYVNVHTSQNPPGEIRGQIF